eukprot:GEMP01040034.1.p1 GENE.GEMP01040034.1~~GEMP01040034.1.p1  ORF type:complete len:418 (+),score=46.36 GEMP01040034.1:54-1256(+)
MGICESLSSRGSPQCPFATNACMDTEFEASKGRVNPNSVYANIYDLNTYFVSANTMLYDALQVGGAFHASIQVFGAEWSYGRLGIYSIPPRKNQFHIYRQTIPLGETKIDPHSWAVILHEQMQLWKDFEYNPLEHNCVDFSAAIADILGVTPLPAWVGRVAKVGAGVHDNIKKIESLRQRACSFVGHRIEEFPSMDQIFNLLPATKAERISLARASPRKSLGILMDEMESPSRLSVYSNEVPQDSDFQKCIYRLNNLVHPLDEDGKVIGYTLEVPQKTPVFTIPEDTDFANNKDFHERVARQSERRVTRMQEGPVGATMTEEACAIDNMNDVEGVVCCTDDKGPRVSTRQLYEDNKRGMYNFTAPAPVYFSDQADTTGLLEEPFGIPLPVAVPQPRALKS